MPTTETENRPSKARRIHVEPQDALRDTAVRVVVQALMSELGMPLSVARRLCETFHPSDFFALHGEDDGTPEVDARNLSSGTRDLAWPA